MSFTDLQAEHAALGIGPELWALIFRVSGRIAHRYPPSAYNDNLPWSKAAIEELAQEVVLERLLEENQLDYVFDLATDTDSLARLLSLQVKRVLAHRRSKSVVDRLASRIRNLAREGTVSSREFGRDLWIGSEADDAGPRTLSEAELRRGADLVSDIPRLRSSPTQSRETMVYKADGLLDLVTRLSTEFGLIALVDVRRILDILLTAWLPTILHDHEEDQIGSYIETDSDLSHMDSLIETVATSLDAAQCAVLLGKSNGVSDAALAAQLGRSRPWVADRKTEVLVHVQAALIAELPEELHSEATRRLLDRVAMTPEEQS